MRWLLPMTSALLVISGCTHAQTPAISQPAGDPATRLREAAYRGDLEAIRAALQAGADINSRGKGGETAMGEALKTGHIEAVEFLLRKGANPRLRAAKEWSVLHCIVGGNSRMDLLKLALKNKADVNAADADGTYPLFTAVNAGPKIVAVLLDAGANVNSKNGKTARTPLHAAVLSSASVSKLLIERGADVNAKTKDGKTVLTLLKSGNLSAEQKKTILSLIQKRSR